VEERGTDSAGLVVAVALFALACGSGQEGPSPATAREPAKQSAPGSGVSEAGHYRVSLHPADGEIPLGQLHGWIVEVATADGEPFAPIRLAMDGGMPQHGHGLVTQPRVTRTLGLGRLLVEGVKFHMNGDWRLRLELVGPTGPDVAIFDVRVGP